MEIPSLQNWSDWMTVCEWMTLKVKLASSQWLEAPVLLFLLECISLHVSLLKNEDKWDMACLDKMIMIIFSHTNKQKGVLKGKDLVVAYLSMNDNNHTISRKYVSFKWTIAHILPFISNWKNYFWVSLWWRWSWLLRWELEDQGWYVFSFSTPTTH